MPQQKLIKEATLFTPTSAAKRVYHDTSPEVAVGAMTVAELKSIFAEALKNTATKEDVEKIATNIQTVRQENAELGARLKCVEAKSMGIERQIEALERKVNEKNIVVTVPKSEVDPITQASKICAEVLKCSNAITSVREIKAKRSDAAILIAELRSKGDVANMLKAGPTLKAKGISVHKDYSAAARNRRRRLVEWKAEIDAQLENSLPMKLQGERLTICGKVFYVNASNQIECDGKNGSDILQNIISQEQEKAQANGGEQDADKNKRF